MAMSKRVSVGKSASPIAALLTLVLALILAACGIGAGIGGGNKVERFAKAVPGSGESIAIPGFEGLSIEANKTTQVVQFKNPAENPCDFVLSLTLDEGEETLWTGEALHPGEEFTTIELRKPLEVGEYPATLVYECFSLEDGTPLNGSEIRLMLRVR